MPSDIKRRVNPTNKTIGNPKAINNSINNEVFYSSNFRSTFKLNHFQYKNKVLNLHNKYDLFPLVYD